MNLPGISRSRREALPNRTPTQDPGIEIDQLVGVALRALSPAGPRQLVLATVGGQ